MEVDPEDAFNKKETELYKEEFINTTAFSHDTEFNTLARTR